MSFKGFKWKLNVGPRLLGGFLLVSILGAMVGVVGLISAQKLRDSAASIYKDELMGISYIKEANIDLIYMDRAVSKALLAATPAQREQQKQLLAEAQKKLDNNMNAAAPLIYSEKGKLALADFRTKYAKYDSMLRDLLAKIDAQSGATAPELLQYYTGTFLQQVNLVDDIITAIAVVKEGNGKLSYEKNEKIYGEVWAITCILLGVTFVGSIALGILISRSIVRPLSDAVALAQSVASGDLTRQVSVRSDDEIGVLSKTLNRMTQSLSRMVGDVRTGAETIATASGQIASGNLDLSSRTEEQASALEQTASSMEEIATTVKQNAASAKEASQLAISASGIAEKGGNVVSQVIDTMNDISHSSTKVVDIISVIDGIAFQTNILALNASVEAARAGEQGRGFAVVASEVRNLAQRSAGAAKEIKSLIVNSAEKVNDGNRLVAEAGVTMSEIVAGVKRVVDIMGEITSASQEQALGVDEVNRAIGQMDTVTQQNAALVEEAAAASEAMKDQAKSLTVIVAGFKTEAGMVFELNEG